MSNLPIRILHFPGTLLYGGVGSVVLNLYRNIDRDKIQFDFCVPRSGRGPFDDEIEELGGRIFSVPRMRKSGIIAYIKCIRKIIVQYGPFYAVHIHSTHMGAIALIAAKYAGVKRRIYHSHSTKDAALEKLPFNNIIEKFLKTIIIKYATDYFACGKDAGLYIYGEKLHNKKMITILNNAIDLEKFKPFSIEQKKSLRKLFGIREESLVIGNVARFVKGKNQQFIINIIAKMINEGTDIVGVFVGDGPLKKKCEKIAERLKVGSNILFLGARSDVNSLYNIMDVYVLPSLFEGLPVTALEAQACGLPCIVSNNVTKEANMDISQFIQLELSKNYNQWTTSIKEVTKYKQFDASRIINKIKEKDYDIISIAKKLERIYLKYDEEC